MCVLGYAMVKSGLPLTPFMLGVILGDQIEINLIRSIMSERLRENDAQVDAADI